MRPGRKILHTVINGLINEPSKHFQKTADINNEQRPVLHGKMPLNNFKLIKHPMPCSTCLVEIQNYTSK